MGTIDRTGWFKSSYSDSSAQCVEVCFDSGAVLVRDSKYVGDPSTQPILTIPASAWDEFLLSSTVR